MNASYEMVRAITIRHSDKIKKFCSPLFNFLNLNECWYYKITNDGHKSFLSSHVDWATLHSVKNYNQSAPQNCHPKFYTTGYYTFRKALNDSKAIPTAKEKFNVNPCILIVNQIEEGIEGFGFSSPSAEDGQIELLLSELSLLRLFSQKFKDELKNILIKLEDYRVDLTKLIGSNFHTNPFPVEPKRKAQKEALLSSLGIDWFGSFSPREVAVLRLLLLGYSAGQIGEKVCLSRRTIEHRIERLKEKLVCYSKAELIQKVRELERFGFLNGTDSGSS